MKHNALPLAPLGLSIAMLILFVSSMPSNTLAQVDNCAALDEALLPAKEIQLGKSGSPQTLKCLTIFADFEDGNNPVYPCSGPDPYPKPIWDGSQTPVPAWAHDLMPDLGQPYVDGSLSHFYDLMSGGLIDLKGQVYPDVVKLNSIAWYNSTHGLNALNTAVKDAIDEAAANVDLTQWNLDQNDDDYVDFVFVYFRAKAYVNTDGDFVYIQDGSGNCGTGWSCGGVATLLQPADIVVGTQPDGADLKVGTLKGAIITHAAKKRDFNNTVEIFAHELGHNSHKYFGNSSGSHNTHWGWYSVMHGDTGRLGITPYHRTQNRANWGWVQPYKEYTAGVAPLLDGVELTESLKDVGLHVNQGYLRVSANTPGQIFQVEVRDPSVSVFTQGTGDIDDFTDSCTPKLFPAGAFIAHTNFGGRWLELPSGRFDLTTLEPDILAGETELTRTRQPNGWLDNVGSHRPTYLPGADGSNLFAPYTNPSSDVHLGQLLPQDVYSGLTFYNFNWISQPGIDGEGELEFKIRYDATPPAPGDPYVLPNGMIWDGHIQLIGDVLVPAGSTLTILPGATIVAAKGQDKTGGGSDPNAVEIIVEGNLICDGTLDGITLTSSDDDDFRDWVVWTGHTSSTQSEGDHWAGVHVENSAQGTDIVATTIAHASTALTINDPDDITVKDSTITQFADYGVVADNTLGAGLTLDNNNVVRGSLDADNKGLVGIHLSSAPQVDVIDNTVDMSSLPSTASNAAAIRVGNGFRYCMELGLGVEQLMTIKGNTLTGPGTLAGAGAGLDLIYACGLADRDLLVEDNTIAGWKNSSSTGTGIRIEEGSDIDFLCNDVSDVDIGVDITRDELPGEPAFRFKTNTLVASSIGVQTDNGKKTKLGPNNLTRGKNEIEVPAGGVLIARLDDPATAGILNAKQNRWVVDGAGITDAATIRSHCTPSPSPLTDPGLLKVENAVAVGPACDGVGQGEAPKTRVGREERILVHPNPFNPQTTVHFSVPQAGNVSMDVYDLQGRLVRSLFSGHLDAGEHHLTWNGTDEVGRRVASGVYYFRLNQSVGSQTKKAVLLK